jgi:tryptophan-rich sensory protein
MSRRSDTLTEYFVLAGLVAVVAAVGVAGHAITAPQIAAWYEPSVVKPSFTPPDWLFAPVWTVLYLLMAVAAWLVWRETGWPGARRPWTFWAVQLALGLAWTWLFFGLHRVGWSLAEAGLLFVAIAATIREFRKYSAPAAWLLAPYIVWVAFAGLLNFEIWRLSP